MRIDIDVLSGDDVVDRGSKIVLQVTYAHNPVATFASDHRRQLLLGKTLISLYQNLAECLVNAVTLRIRPAF